MYGKEPRNVFRGKIQRINRRMRVLLVWEEIMEKHVRGKKDERRGKAVLGCFCP